MTPVLYSGGRSVSARCCAALSEALVAASKLYKGCQHYGHYCESINLESIPSSDKYRRLRVAFPIRVFPLIKRSSSDWS